MTAVHLRYLAKATRWQLIGVGALLGAAAIIASHVTDAGPFSTVHLGIVLGTVGIAVGAAFLLDDAAATTLAAVPATLRRRSLLRIACGAVVAATALSGLLVVAWTRLDHLDAAVQALVIILVAVGGAAAAGRVLGWARPGAVGAGAVTALLIADGLPVRVYEGVLLTGGAGGVDGTASVVPISLTAAALAGLAWGTRDPARGPPSRRHDPTETTAGSTTMRYDRLEQTSPKTFVFTGALMGIAMVLFGLLLLELPTFPLFMLAIALTGLAAATGLLGLQRRLRARTPGLARVGAGASVLAASAALVLVAVIPVAFVVVEGLGREVGFVDPLFLISMVTMLAGLLLGLLVVGAATLRSDLSAPAVGGLLIAGGLLFLIPLANFLLDVAAPEAIALATFGIGAAIFIKVGRLLRAEAPTPAHGPATTRRMKG